MLKYSIIKIATLIGARRVGDTDAQIGWLLTDSRSLCFPEETLFFALKSARNDGHKYISDLYRRGVRNFVVESRGIQEFCPNRASDMKDANFLIVPSPLAALQRLAERHRDEFDIPIVGITGSNGKTMVKEWLYQILLPSQKIVRSPKSYNSQIGVPLSVWLLNEKTEVGIFEAGISEPGEMMALRDIIQPTVGVFTSLGSAHQENFRSMEEKCMEKLELMHDTQAMIYCSDNDIVSRCIRRMQYKGEKIAWSQCDEQVAFFVKAIDGNKISYCYKGEDGAFEIPFSDEASIEDSITCAATALYLGITPEQLYAQVSDLCVKRGIQKFIGIGPDLSAQADKILIADKQFFLDVQHFLASDTFGGLRDELILLKGARSFGFDQITEQLEQKVHETILEVNLNAVVANLNYYRSFLKPDTKMVCMIKADAYGAGAVEIAKTLQDHRVDYLAVAVADEGVTLRKAGITANIMIMNPEMTAFKTMFDYDLEPEVYSFRLLDALVKAARKEGITGWPVHIKLDTGMHRLGFDPINDIDELIDRLRHQNAIIPRSVFSHFVGSDSDGFDDFSARQFALFDEGSKRLQAAFTHKILRHLDNSAGIEHFPERQMDMCRLGLGLYGVDPRDNRILNTVSTLKTTILQMRHVPAGDTVGYSRKGKIDHDSVIAAIPIGYADGLNRHLGNRRCYCLVNGQKAEYVGNICMDVAMIDVTGIDCREGDMVEIFGEHLPVTTLSDIIDTIPYEVLTGVSNRVKRVYFQD